VFCGESFHWFDRPLALPEIARVLRPGEHLAMEPRPDPVAVGGLDDAQDRRARFLA
jgi:hypothetical protein